jgi:hypothetical protein
MLARGRVSGIALHKEHATIHTASIDVKIIRLDRRQVTMSVFRQLDEDLIFSSGGTLRGVPWGRVNYVWKDNPKGTAFNVVWQEGEHLKRSPVPFEYSGDSRWYEWVVGDLEKAPKVDRNAETRAEGYDERAKRFREILRGRQFQPYEVLIYSDNCLAAAYLRAGFVKHNNSVLRPKGFSSVYCGRTCGRPYGSLNQGNLEPRELKEFRKCLGKAVYYLSQEAAKVRRLKDEQESRYEVWGERRRALEESFWERVREMSGLEQLFIAV